MKTPQCSMCFMIAEVLKQPSPRSVFLGETQLMKQVHVSREHLWKLLWLVAAQSTASLTRWLRCQENTWLRRQEVIAHTGVCDNIQHTHLHGKHANANVCYINRPPPRCSPGLFRSSSCINYIFHSWSAGLYAKSQFTFCTNLDCCPFFLHFYQVFCL